MHERWSLPRARRSGLLEETVGEEILLYDRSTHTAHCLSSIAAMVWRHCDGERDLAELATLADTSERLAAEALHELREKDLIDTAFQSITPGESRREAIGRVARYGAAAATGSLIASATAVTPALASSGETLTCKASNENASCCYCNDGECMFVTPEIMKAECEGLCNNGHKGVKEFLTKAHCP